VELMNRAQGMKRQANSSKSIASSSIVASLIILAISVLGISKNPNTPFDEPAHFDYVVKIAKGHLPKVNEKYSQSTLEWMACESSKPEAWMHIEECGSQNFTPKKAPFWGQNPATGYAPNYYVLTAVPYKACILATEFSSIQCARFANSGWLSLAAGVSVMVMMQLGLASLLSILVAIGFFTLPAVLLQGITVNSDAAAMATSVIFVASAILLTKRKSSFARSLLIYQILVFFILPIKQTSLPMAAFGGLLLWSWTESKSNMSKPKSAAVSMGAFFATVITTFLWQSFQILWRDSGYKDYMTGWLEDINPPLLDSLNLAFVSGLQPFSLLTWSPIIGRYSGTLAVLIALLCWVSLLSNLQVPPDPINAIESENLPISSPIAFCGFLLAIITPVFMAATAFFLVGSSPVNPRYYMATAVTLGCIGIARSSSWPLRFFSILVLATSALLTVSLLT
jgi:hypothetical protein